MKERIEFRQVREFNEIIGDTMLFIKQNVKPLTKTFFTFCGIFILGSMMNSILTQLKMVNLLEDVKTGNSSGNPFGLIYNFGVNYVLLIFFMILNYTSIYVAILSYISIYIQKQNTPPTLTEVWTYFKFFFLRVFGSGILMSLLLMIAFMACLLPGLYIFPAVSLFYVVIVMENAGFGRSFSRPYRLLLDEWWLTAATLLIIWIITYACMLAVQMPALILQMASSFTHLEKPIAKGTTIFVVVSQQLSQIFLIIPIIGSALIYFNLVERKESTGLLSRIDNLGQHSSAPPTENIPEEY